jgi:hypothetical protein
MHSTHNSIQYFLFSKFYSAFYPTLCPPVFYPTLFHSAFYPTLCPPVFYPTLFHSVPTLCPPVFYPTLCPPVYPLFSKSNPFLTVKNRI